MRLKRVAATLAVPLLVGTLAACGSSSNAPAAAADAAAGCQVMTNLESEVVNRDGPGAKAANQVLTRVQTELDSAAAQDHRWKRLLADFTLVHHDLSVGSSTGMSAALNDIAGICSPALSAPATS